MQSTTRAFEGMGRALPGLFSQPALAKATTAARTRRETALSSADDTTVTTSASAQPTAAQPATISANPAPGSTTSQLGRSRGLQHRRVVSRAGNATKSITDCSGAPIATTSSSRRQRGGTQRLLSIGQEPRNRPSAASRGTRIHRLSSPGCQGRGSTQNHSRAGRHASGKIQPPAKLPRNTASQSTSAHGRTWPAQRGLHGDGQGLGRSQHCFPAVPLSVSQGRSACRQVPIAEGVSAISEPDRLAHRAVLR